MLYVGKAKNLRSRLASYTRVGKGTPRTYKLVNTAKKISLQPYDTVFEASLVESELISSYQPAYNVRLKDDKSPLYILITHDPYPRVITARKKTLLTIHSHLKAKNVFGPFPSVTAVKQILKVARRIFRYCSLRDKSQNRPCFYTHLNLCSGACTGAITIADYQTSITHLRLFLRGQKRPLVTSLKRHMRSLSHQHRYEDAAELRDQFQALEFLFHPSALPHQETELPILGSDLTSAGLTQTAALLHNAGLVPTSYTLNRIEAYDISNTMGTYSTASMVVFEAGQPAPSEYKHFKIRFTHKGGDTAKLKEVLKRRLNHPEWTHPDLIVIDGGKGQLGAARSVIKDHIPTVSIVKHPDRLLVPVNNQLIAIKLAPGHPVSNLIQHLRDESHRFAKNYHTLLRRKAMTST